MSTLTSRHEAVSLRDRIAFAFVKMLRFFADAFFRKRYGHRAVVLETVAAVPGMVGGMLQHLKSLRYLRDDRGWVRELLDEAENERMHLMTFVEIAHPSMVERLLIMIAQAIFFCVYFVVYLLSPATAHRVVGYFE
ncbi:MAG: alternative oxidase, partial [Xanthomonadales bacterium]|nr:alternative oxidase [Xanthomonadales bacterium]